MAIIAVIITWAPEELSINLIDGDHKCIEIKTFDTLSANLV